MISKSSGAFDLPRENELHVWKLLVSKTSPSLLDLTKLLSTDEKERAERFRRVEDRHRFIAARGGLRCLLGGYMEVVPQGIVFSLNAFGKPGLVSALSSPRLEFNLAHSEDMVLFAVALGRQVGIDVERISPRLEVLDLARSHFSTQEIAALEGLPRSEQTAAFYRVWTRKEAYIKAWGLGLSMPLDQFAVTVGGEEPAELCWATHAGAAEKEWSMFHVDPGAGYVGAAVVEGRGLTLRAFDCDFFS